MFLAQAAVIGALAPLMRVWAASAPGSIAPMKTYRIPQTDLTVSRIGYGCADLGGAWDREPITADAVAKASRLIQTAYDHGITLFDHADIYCHGKSESAFGEVLKQSPGLRQRIVIQSKYGVHLADPNASSLFDDPPRLDFSAAHIVSAVEGSLSRLGTDRLDILLLHRPDPLVEPDEVAKAFDSLKQSGKVRYFGVSNHSPAQIELLKKSVRQPLVVNQVQIGLAHSTLITDGMEFNRSADRLTHEYTGAVGGLDYCRLHDIQVQAWSPLRGVPLTKSLPADATAQVKQFAQVLGDLAKAKNAPRSAVALAWLLHHPAGILPITGPQSLDYLIENCAADRVMLSRAEWYALLMAGGGFGAVA